MATMSYSRQASPDEMAAEIDRRCRVIEGLEAERDRLAESERFWKDTSASESRARIDAEAKLAALTTEAAERVTDDWKLPCEVMVAPATRFGKGIAINTVLDSIRRREGREHRDTVFRRARPMGDDRFDPETTAWWNDLLTEAEEQELEDSALSAALPHMPAGRVTEDVVFDLFRRIRDCWDEDECPSWDVVEKPIDDLIKLFKAAFVPAGRWQPIETAPKDESWFLAYFPSLYEEDSYKPCRWKELRGWQDAADSEPSDPTHWMPLPPAPSEKGGR